MPVAANFGLAESTALAILDETGDDPYGGAMSILHFAIEVALESHGAMNNVEHKNLITLHEVLKQLDPR